MATKKPTKKPPAPPKIIRMDIVLDAQRQDILKKLEQSTGIKANTKILFHCAEYYLTDKPAQENRIRNQQNEIRDLQSELRSLKSSVSSFVAAFDNMKQSISNNPVSASEDSNKNSVYKKCPDCGNRCYFDSDNDNFYCSICDYEFD